LFLLFHPSSIIHKQQQQQQHSLGVEIDLVLDLLP
jgi:hypothetical protein